MLQEWKKKDWLEKYTKQKKAEKEIGEDRGKRGWKKWERHMKQEEKMGGRKENVQRQKSGNKYGGETHEAQFRTILHLTGFLD